MLCMLYSNQFTEYTILVYFGYMSTAVTSGKRALASRSLYLNSVQVREFSLTLSSLSLTLKQYPTIINYTNLTAWKVNNVSNCPPRSVSPFDFRILFF